MRIEEHHFEFIVRGIGENGIIRFGDFTLASGKKSPVYIDLRMVFSFPGLRKMAAEAMTQIVAEDIGFDIVAGIPTAGVPFATLIADRMGEPMITPRMKEKDHGSGAKVDGVFEAGQTVLVVDDLITTAGSKFKAISVLEEVGLIVKDVLVLVDRQQGGAEELATRGYTLHAAFTISEMLEYMVNHGNHGEGMIDREQYKMVMEYLFPR